MNFLVNFFQQHPAWFLLILVLIVLLVLALIGLLVLNHRLRSANQRVVELLEQMQKLAAHLPGVIYQFRRSPQGQFTIPYASQELPRLFGIDSSETECTADAFFARIHPDDHQEVMASIDQSAQKLTEWKVEFRVVHPGGRQLWVEGRSTPEQLADSSVIWHGYIMDITERRAFQAALVESESRFRQFAENVGQVFWLRTNDEMLYVNQAYANIWGRSCESLYADPGSFMDSVHPEDKAGFLQAIEQEQQPSGLLDYTYRIIRPEGSVRWINARSYPIFDGNLNLIRTAGIASDVTEQVEMEASLRASNEELEQFAYVASHDLRQPLRMINSYLQLLERYLDPYLQEDTRKMMNFASEGARRLDQMLLSLLEYSRVGRNGQPMHVQPASESAQEALDFLAPQIRDTSAVINWQPQTWPQAYACRDELTRLFQNLIGNALKYHEPNQVPQVDMDVKQVSEGWQFCIRDQGIGIDPNQFEHLFGVFKRLQTQNEYEGTGIGLAVARKIVERHGGSIWVESQGEGQGSAFCFVLPEVNAQHEMEGVDADD